MFKQRQHKMKIAEVEALGSDTLMNVIFHHSRFPKTLKCYHEDMSSGDSLLWGVNGKEAVQHLGKPNVNMIGYESRPGAWVFDHEPTGIILVIFSDGHRKNPYKGTSYELANLPTGMSDEDLLGLYKELMQMVTGIDDLYDNRLSHRERLKRLLFGVKDNG